jgi:hypothetical protein
MSLGKTLAFAFALLFVSGADADEPVAPDAKAELRAAIDILKAHHMNSAKLDWPAVEADAQKILDGAKAEDAYPAIRYIITQLGEKHTFLQNADWAKAQMSGKQVGNARPPDWITPEGHLLAGGIGLVHLEDLMASDADNIAYAHATRQALWHFAHEHVCRYIVDLRHNGGGNMHPMINGLETLLGKPPYGYWQFTGSTTDDPWPGTNGLFKSAKDLPFDPRTIAVQAKAPVAVLIDDHTGSSGEFTAMAFEGRPNTRIFGENSAGYLTVNDDHDLPDGARLLVSEGWATDRLHRPYRTVIAPDEQTERGQPTLDAAIHWLKAQPCRG